jgi:hypothetical protein
MIRLVVQQQSGCRDIDYLAEAVLLRPRNVPERIKDASERKFFEASYPLIVKG